MPHLDVLRARLANYRKRAAIVPGLPELIDTIEAHLVETETRLMRLEERFPEHHPTVPPGQGGLL